MRAKPLALRAAVALALLLAPAAGAAIFSVNIYGDSHDANPGDGVAKDASGRTSLRAAIEEANALPGRDIVAVNLCEPHNVFGCYSLTLHLGPLIISDDVELESERTTLQISPLAGSNTPKFRAFHVLSGVKVLIYSFRISGFSATHGAGMLVEEGAEVNVQCEFVSCHATGDGGGIYLQGGTLYGGPNFTSCTALGNGGGLYVASGTVSPYSSTTLTANRAAGSGGGAYFAAGEFQSNGIFLYNNIAVGDGGGLYVGTADVVLRNRVNVSGNTATGSGGGIYLGPDSTISLSGTPKAGAQTFWFGGNTCGRDGGALYTAGAALDLRGVDFSTNRGRNGGAIHAVATEIHLERCGFLFNSALGAGGAISATAADLNLVNVTLGENNAPAGGALWLTEQSNAELSNSTLYKNVAPIGAAADLGPESAIHLGNSIVCKNTLGANGPTELLGPGFHSLGGNLLGPVSESFVAHSTDISGVTNPRLNPYVSYSYRYYYPPSEFSPALNAGRDELIASPPFTEITDQRGSGFPRIFGSQVDIGAIEIQNSPMPPHSADVNGDGGINLTELMRAIQFHSMGAFHCDADTEDGYAPGEDTTAQECTPHSADYAPHDWDLSIGELLRLIQFYNAGGYTPCQSGEDGFCPVQFQ